MVAILALDTATENCSVAVNVNGQIYSQSLLASQQHTQLILPMVQEILAVAELSLRQLTALAFGKGPGSFTGVRIAAGVVQGLACAADLPVVPISTLRALAQGGYRKYQVKQILAAIDARMQEIYWGAYQLNSEGCMQALVADQVTPTSALPTRLDGEWVAVGTGCAVADFSCPNYISQTYANIYPQAEDIATLAQFDYQQGIRVSAEQALPVYLRDKVT